MGFGFCNSLDQCFDLGATTLKTNECCLGARAGDAVSGAGIESDFFQTLLQTSNIVAA